LRRESGAEFRWDAGCGALRPAGDGWGWCGSAMRCKGGMASLTLAGSCEAVTGRVGHTSLSNDRAAYVMLSGLMPGEPVRASGGSGTSARTGREAGSNDERAFETDRGSAKEIGAP
jgi:hypothetical protein